MGLTHTRALEPSVGPGSAFGLISDCFSLESWFHPAVTASSGTQCDPRVTLRHSSEKLQLRLCARVSGPLLSPPGSACRGPVDAGGSAPGRLGGEAQSWPAATTAGSQGQAVCPLQLCHLCGWRPCTVVLTPCPPLEASCMFIGARTAGSFPSWLNDLSLCLSLPFCEVGGASVRNQR